MRNIVIPGQKFHRLTVVRKLTSKIDGRAGVLCKCDCGKPFIVDALYKLITGNNKSCGCLRSETSSRNLSIVATNQRQFHPVINSARSVFRERYADGSLTFDEFYAMALQNCAYCGAVSANVKFTPHANATQYHLDNCKFIYNGLDRVNNEQGHHSYNCVPCCMECNKSKRNMPLDQFLSMVKQIHIGLERQPPNYRELFEENQVKLDQFKRITGKLRCRYEDIEQFDPVHFFVMTLQCFYCGAYESNSIKCKNGDRIACNGMDRIDQTKSHSIDNIVPCCKFCNWSKAARSMQEFRNWAERVYQHLFVTGNIERLDTLTNREQGDIGA